MTVVIELARPLAVCPRCKSVVAVDNGRYYPHGLIKENRFGNETIDWCAASNIDVPSDDMYVIALPS